MTHRKEYILRLSMLALVMAFLCIPAFTAQNRRPVYRLDVTLDPDANRASGNVEIRWYYNGYEPLKRIPFLLDNGKGEKDLISRCRINGTEAGVEYSFDSDGKGFAGFWARPPKPLAPGKWHSIRIDFQSGELKDYSFLRYAYFCERWFPQVAGVKRGEPRDLDRLADFYVTYRFPSRMTSCPSGIITDQKNRDGVKEIKSRVENISSFGIFISDELEKRIHREEDLTIRSFYRKKDEKWGKFLLQKSREIITFYRNTIGFYPQSVLNILPGYDKPWGGYPIAGNSVLIHRGLDARGEDFASWIMAHEIGHQYWGFGTILENREYPRWFGLSMGIYTDQLYSRAAGLKTTHHQSFRERYLAGLLAGFDTTILQPVTELEERGFDWNNIVAHGKAFTVLRMLEQQLGEEGFLRVFRECLNRFRGKMVTYESFQALCEEISGRDLGWFFHQWYETDGYLDYRIRSCQTRRIDSRFLTECRVVRRGEAVMPVSIALQGPGGREQLQEWNGWSEKKNLTFHTEFPPSRVVLDPDNRLPLMSDAEMHLGAGLFAIRELMDLKRYDRAWELLHAFSQSGRIEPEYWYRRLQACRGNGDYKALPRILEKLDSLSGHRNHDFYMGHALVRMGQTRDILGRRDEALQFYRRALKYKSGREEAEKYIQNAFTGE